MTVTLTCKQISPRPGPYGEVRWDAEVTNQDDAVRRRRCADHGGEGVGSMTITKVKPAKIFRPNGPG